ncbi:hypothetical protein Scep_022081 [Stephania cephalantha]|uniref:Uncharacterized protein n=1 Tax=Stephania cephalantha TaxID=152367 RepID=A0AAP0I0Q0_9MAGN
MKPQNPNTRSVPLLKSNAFSVFPSSNPMPNLSFLLQSRRLRVQRGLRRWRGTATNGGDGLGCGEGTRGGLRRLQSPVDGDGRPDDLVATSIAATTDLGERERVDGDFELVRQDEVDDELRGNRGGVGVGWGWAFMKERGVLGGSMLGISFFHASTNADSMDCSTGRLLEKSRTEVLIVAAFVAEQGRIVREALLSMRLGDGGRDSTPTIMATADKATMEEDDGEEGGGDGRDKKVIGVDEKMRRSRR